MMPLLRLYVQDPLSTAVVLLVVQAIQALSLKNVCCTIHTAIFGSSLFEIGWGIVRDLVLFVSVVGVHPNLEMGSILHLLLDGFSGRNAPHTRHPDAKVHTGRYVYSYQVVSTENKA
jgi:hypothetical protein